MEPDHHMTAEQFALALDFIVARTGDEGLRALCRDDHPDHARWRAEVARMAGGSLPADPPPVAVDHGTADPGPCGGCPGW